MIIYNYQKRKTAQSIRFRPLERVTNFPLSVDIEGSSIEVSSAVFLNTIGMVTSSATRDLRSFPKKNETEENKMKKEKHLFYLEALVAGR